MGSARSRRSRWIIHGDGRRCRVLRLEVGDLIVLQELLSSHPLDHHQAYPQLQRVVLEMLMIS
jgi:hypothetical protein